VVDRDSGADRVCRGYECHQFHGRDQRYHGWLCAGGAGAAGFGEWMPDQVGHDGGGVGHD